MTLIFDLEYSVHKLVTDERTNRRTDEWTKGQVENIMRPASLDWRTDKYSIMFVVVIAFVCFLSAFCPRSLSFLFTSLGKER